MSLPKIGLVTFGDHRKHEWENYFSGLAIPRHQEIIDYLQQLPVELSFSEQVARTKFDIDEQIDVLKAAGVAVVVAHIPCWTSPNLVVRGVQRLN